MMWCCYRDDDEDDNPEAKVIREKVRRQANNARERSVVALATCIGSVIYSSNLKETPLSFNVNQA